MVSVVVAGARTPMGRLQGALSTVGSTALGGVSIRAALERSGLAAAQVDHVVLGQVLTAGVGQIPARQAAVAGGIGMDVPALTVNKVCLSGLNAVVLADLMIRAGEADVVIAGGMESMSAAPHLLLGSRAGHAFGDVTLRDHMSYDGLWDAFTDQAMGGLTEAANAADRSFSREQQDEWAARSHRLAAAAQRDGLLGEEIAAVPVPQRRGDPVLVELDEGIRADTTAQSLARLRPAFRPDGTITAGSSSQISDGAAAVVVARKDLVESLGLGWLAEIGANGSVAGPDSSLQTQPSAAVRAACAKAGLDPAGLDRYEINEAFAAVALASVADLGLDDATAQQRVNPHGGAIALGHPIGMSGARLVLSLALELRRSGGGTGVAALCGGGGQGDALLLSVPRG